MKVFVSILCVASMAVSVFGMSGCGSLTLSTRTIRWTGMTVVDFATGEKKLTVALDNPNNFTCRCVYYE